MAVLNDFKKISLSVGIKSRNMAGNPYKFAEEEVNKFVNNDKDKLLQLVSESNGYRQLDYNVIYLSMATISISLSNCLFNIFKCFAGEIIAGITILVVLLILFCFGEKICNKPDDTAIGAHYVKVAIEQRYKRLNSEAKPIKSTSQKKNIRSRKRKK